MNTDDTWVVVADGGGARIFRTDAEMLEITRIEQLGNDHSAGTHRHREQGGTDSAHHAAEKKFAHELAQKLTQYANQHRFRDLVLVAPPHFLGDLRNDLPKSVAAHVTASLPKDLASEPDHQLAPHLRKLLAGQHLDAAR